ncbi:hypothetical protein LCGC14_2945440 [marine sediment metagenome]|uniref:Uncharacterized protein n=1 Tax=marine sediment metagenome TaxID=412755 RepID=A0A0F8Y3T6_9ZZZZ
MVLSVEDAPVDAPSIMATSLHQWLVSRMLNWMPTGRSFFKHAKETREEGKKRYEKIADAMIRVVYDPVERPLFGGKYGRAKTLALVASMSWFESGWRKDVDLGLGSFGIGDQGQSWCMMQILLGRKQLDGKSKNRITLTEDYYTLLTSPRNRVVGWGGEDLVKDRVACFRTGLHLARRSFHGCRNYHVRDRLGIYGSGGCIKNWTPSRIRVKKAQKWLSIEKPPLTDKEAMALLHPPESQKPLPDVPGNKEDPVAMLPRTGSVGFMGSFRTVSFGGPFRIFPEGFSCGMVVEP